MRSCLFYISAFILSACWERRIILSGNSCLARKPCHHPRFSSHGLHASKRWLTVSGTQYHLRSPHRKRQNPPQIWRNSSRSRPVVPWRLIYGWVLYCLMYISLLLVLTGLIPIYSRTPSPFNRKRKCKELNMQALQGESISDSRRIRPVFSP